jgi:hypothetical protein
MARLFRIPEQTRHIGPERSARYTTTMMMNAA